VIMRDRKTQTFRRECKPTDGRGRVERFLLSLAAADKGGLAGRPCDRPIGMQGDIVDPAPFWVGRKQRDLAFDIERDQLAVIAAQYDALAIRCRAQDAAAMDSDRRDFALAAHQEDAFLSPDE